jgi:chromosome segregation ATPase
MKYSELEQTYQTERTKLENEYQVSMATAKKKVQDSLALLTRESESVAAKDGEIARLQEMIRDFQFRSENTDNEHSKLSAAIQQKEATNASLLEINSGHETQIAEVLSKLKQQESANSDSENRIRECEMASSTFKTKAAALIRSHQARVKELEATKFDYETRIRELESAKASELSRIESDLKWNNASHEAEVAKLNETIVDLLSRLTEQETSQSKVSALQGRIRELEPTNSGLAAKVKELDQVISVTPKPNYRIGIDRVRIQN